jgi:hypothetical protein
VVCYVVTRFKLRDLDLNALLFKGLYYQGINSFMYYNTYTMKRKELGEASVRRNYAFSQRTIENLKWLIDHRIYRNETEAIDLAIERMRTIYEMTEETSKKTNPDPEDIKQSRRCKAFPMCILRE